MKPQIKICGFTHADDVRAAVALGVDYIGLNVAKGPRKISCEQAVELSALVPDSIAVVLLFVDAELSYMRECLQACGSTHAQLHGAESQSVADELRQDAAIIKAFRVRDASSLEAAQKFQADIILLDAYVAGSEGGTGHAWDYSMLQQWPETLPMMLAGGLRAENLVDAIERCQPQAIDIASGVESEPGRKDADKMQACVNIIRGMSL